MNSNRFSLFVPHGSPMFALQPAAAGAALAEIGRQFRAAKAVVVISPHWETEIPTVGFAARPVTIHDFGGFDSRLFEIRYPAAGDPQAAQAVLNALSAAEFPAKADPERGLDHGVWVPLLHMFPQADIPVIPLSLQAHKGPAHAYRIGQALAPLAERGFLIVGSGNVTHNLRDWQMIRALDGRRPEYVDRFADWVNAQMLAGNIEALLSYRSRQPDAARAHPTDEHLLPLMTALGAAGESAKPYAFFRGISDHVLAMDGYGFH
jgi:4,5-DOPA dioxygenase extradiol